MAWRVLKRTQWVWKKINKEIKQTFYFQLFSCHVFICQPVTWPIKYPHLPFFSFFFSFFFSPRNHILFRFTSFKLYLKAGLLHDVCQWNFLLPKMGANPSSADCSMPQRSMELTHLSSRLYSPLTKYKSETKHTSRRMDGSLSLRINLPQIRYSCGSFLHINSCIYRDYFGNLLAFTLEICAGSLLHPWLLSSINLVWAQRDFLSLFPDTQCGLVY